MVDRTLGEGIPISIGSAIPFEEKIVADGQKPKQIYFNILTLFRNFYESFKADDKIPFEKGYQIFTEELTTIGALCNNMKVKPILYHPLYNNLPRYFKGAKFRFPFNGKEGTKSQMQYIQAEKTLITQLTNNGSFPVQPFYLGQNQLEPFSWILTHQPVNLLHLPITSNYWLLESYTGALKPSSEWFSKLSKESTIQQFPFNVFTLKLFGDKVMISPQPAKLRRAVMEIGIRRNWNKLTTLDGIRNDLRFYIKDKGMKEQCRILLS